MHRSVIRRAVAATAVTAALAFALPACAASTGSTAEDGGSTPITVLYAAIAYEPAFIALQEGYFEEAGLDVELKRGGAPQDNLAQAVGGSADIIVAAWDTMTTSRAEAMPVRVIGGNSVVSDEVDTSGVVVREDSGLASIEDLEGRTVAFDSLGAGGSSEFAAALREAGVDPASVEQVAIPYAAQLAALEQQQVDAIFPSDPFYTQYVAAPGVEVIANPVRETRANVPITLWAASEQWLAEHGDDAEKFLEALQKGIDFYNDPANLDAIKEIRAEVGGVDVSAVSDTLPRMRIEIDTEASSRAVQQLVDAGTITKPVAVEEIIWTKAPTL